MGTLVLVRHGLSQWNLENRFAGWNDIPTLADRGRDDTRRVAPVLKDFVFDVAWTSRLRRATETLDILLEGIGQQNIPVEKDSGLNERYYGDLQGLKRSDVIKKHGEEQVRLWRRSYSTQPPNGESIADCEKRVLPVFKQYILPLVESGKTVLIAGHGNGFRPMFRYLDNLDEDAMASLEVLLTTPYVYRFEGKKVVEKTILTVPGIVVRVDQNTGEQIIQQ